ncbi:hypothetical protein V6N13_091581 [Hibiscus sabdariffa]
MVGSSINNDERDMDNIQHVLSEDIPNENGQELEKLNNDCNGGLSWTAIVENGTKSKGTWGREGEKTPLNNRAVGDLFSMGFKNQELFNLNSVEDDLDQDIFGDQIEERSIGAVSWTEWVDQLNNNLNPKVSSLYGNSGANIENPTSYGPSISLPEMQPFRVKQK